MAKITVSSTKDGRGAQAVMVDGVVVGSIRCDHGFWGGRLVGSRVDTAGGSLRRQVVDELVKQAVQA